MALVGLMYNLKGDPPDDGEPPDLGAEFDSESTILAVQDALRSYGHDVLLIEGDEEAYCKLQKQKPDIVFNMCEGIRGESRESHIPAILEMLGIPYTGSGVLTLSVCLDKPITKKVLAYHGIPTPKFKVFDSVRDVELEGLEFPLFVKPTHEGSSMGITPSSVCRDENELFREVASLTNMYKQSVLVEEYLPGREFTVGIIGNKNPVVFPIMEINFDRVPEEHGRIYSRQFKVEWSDEVYYTCPARLDPELELAIQSVALKTYQVLGCRDLARIDLRLDAHGVPNVMEINPLPGLSPGYSDYPRIAEKAGWSYVELINGILNCALYRYNLAHLAASDLLSKEIA